MIKFFRKIRYDLMGKNKTGKYLKYAVGEIVLVVIGILIALSINNWNENRKEDKISQEYLTGINNDMIKDLEQIDEILKEQIISISLISNIDNVFVEVFHEPEKHESFFNAVDTSKVKYLFSRGKSYRPRRGTYNSLISDGKSGFIKNRNAFQLIQEIYDEENLRVASSYEAIKEIESKMILMYPYQKKYWTYSDLKKSKDDKIFLDLSNFTEQKYFYAGNLFRLKEKMLSVLKIFETEIINK
ncbi:DUF6090 family protein [Winogradskyella aurantia]|uniref:Uncharacterized protein n=1 Tax=Winogradskyella aurantia TaxID=1915063 RepID=A0A265UXQ6_9FLAO|nr:DUF6090 family protein [Winogradskyella aurantia]OZV70108.1 hypothetical protein CA834_05680 [Winogradskyella aurantia]